MSVLDTVMIACCISGWHRVITVAWLSLLLTRQVTKQQRYIKTARRGRLCRDEKTII